MAVGTVQEADATAAETDDDDASAEAETFSVVYLIEAKDED
jgi:hypothetical protein